MQAFLSSKYGSFYQTSWFIRSYPEFAMANVLRAYATFENNVGISRQLAHDLKVLIIFRTTFPLKIFSVTYICYRAITKIFSHICLYIV